MQTLTTKELSYLKDSINLEKNHVVFFQACADTCQDNQAKEICNKLVKDHQQNIQVLSKHITG
jgi:hypothetical protein